ncbi:ABC transporter substrate-binding protein [Phragmitibacter flavus]|uniref:ABC transporter substrate-binding protein n=1 Tax=Phragmitibacter flavus TaxID=2576071 RepID=A0A5R8KAR2_9BACT|nr:ABC transporter substrate-binding protein [Phragmitibacter flavus]TLD69403.1 ABC transporter substrate-binding protein [Phragmitibacter flavus]
MKRLPFILSLCLATLVLPMTASAETEAAVQKLKSAVGDVLAVADGASSPAALAQKLGPVLNKHVSFEAMTRRAVGPGWRSFSPDQQKEATKLFSTLVIRTYSAKFTPGAKPVIDYQTATNPAKGRVDVPTKMQYQGSRYSVDYRLEQGGGWLITDVVIEGVSMIANYRSQLDAQFKKGGAASVISALNQSLSRS